MIQPEKQRLVETSKKIITLGSCDGISCEFCPSSAKYNNGDQCTNNSFHRRGYTAYSIDNLGIPHLDAFRKFIEENDITAIAWGYKDEGTGMVSPTAHETRHAAKVFKRGWEKVIKVEIREAV